MNPTLVLLIGLGSAIGGMGRYIVDLAFVHRIGIDFPWATISVNILGSFIIGIIAGLAGPFGERELIHPMLRQFLMIGVLGGFTTFSSFSLQSILLLKNGQFPLALANVLLSVTICLLGAWLGLLAGERLG